MNNSLTKNEKVDAYFGIIEEYVIKPVETGEVGNHCVAALVLIFAAIDGLARLTNCVPNANVGKRFKEFIGTLGDKYKARADELYELRNALMHNALNAGTFI